MTHTPSFSKRIHGSTLVSKRLESDESFFTKSAAGKSIINAPIQGILDETKAQYMVYNDFYQRVLSTPVAPVVYIGPRVHSLKIDYSNNISSFIQQYTSDFSTVKGQLDFLGVAYDAYHLYHSTVIDALHHVDQKLVDDHRVGLRSDVVYYDIQDGRIVPDHRIGKVSILGPQYTVRFFLNSNKETVSGVVKNPYDIFGCVALLVNPHDKRYKKARGRDIILPITNRSVPVIPYEGISIEGLGTHVLLPAHNREDFAIAQELGLPIDVYAYDEFGRFTENAKDFFQKPLIDFSENIIKFLDDISNLESTSKKETIEYRDRITQRKLYPILKKNVYIGLGYQTVQDTNFVEQTSNYTGDVTKLQDDISQEENFCITNQDSYYPLLGSFAGYFDTTAVDGQEHNLIQDIVKDFYQWGLLHLPVQGEDLIDIFSLEYDGQYLWQTFFDHRTKEYTYDNILEIHTLLSHISEGIPSDTEIDQVLDYIDLGGYFLHTKQGYRTQDNYIYHYDHDYIALALFVYYSSSPLLDIVTNKDNTTFIKYLLYIHYYYYRKSLQLHIYALEDNNIFTSDWDTIQTLMPDVARIALLQSSHHKEHDIPGYSYSLEEIDRFLNKRWNMSRIIPKFSISTIEEFGKELLQQSSQMNDYEKYLISTVHELYDEVVFSLKKHHTDHITYSIISVLRDKIIDIMIYIVKVRSSPLSDKVAFYTLNFANHLLYPLAPSLITSLFAYMDIDRSTTFFEKDTTFLVNKNIKCNFLMQFINQRYQKTKSLTNVQGFLLKANKDFLDYAKEVLPDFHDFLGKDYTISLLDEHQDWPEDIEFHKVFAMQWGVVTQLVMSDESQQMIPTINLEESLGTLKKQLSYKQQLLQTMKNTLIRMRTTGQKDKILHFQQQIEGLEKDITDIEYKISKLKYF